MATMARSCFVLVILGASVRVGGLSNFRAVGEYLTAEGISDCDAGFSVDSTRYFEEVHYSEGTLINKTALRVDPQNEDASSLFGDFKEGRVYWQLGNECMEVTSNGTVIPHFRSWSFGSESVYAPIYTTLSELRPLMVDDTLTEVFERGLPAVKVEVNLREPSDQKSYVKKAYLIFEQKSDEADYDYSNIIPLSVEVCLFNDGKLSKERLSIMEFAWNTTVEQDASPAAGVQCAGYGRRDLPNVFQMSTLVLRMEQVIDGNVATSDVAVDFERQLLRIDNGVDDYFLSTNQRQEHDHVSTNQVVYQVANPDSRKQSCEIYDAAYAGKLPWTFVEFTTKKVGDFFGVDAGFTIKTKTKRRGIDCDLVSGLRSDYLPERKSPSVWEWCIGDIETAQGVQKYMVHLDIYIQDKNGTMYQESYSLYDVQNVEQKRLYVEYFTELEPCFDMDRKMNLQVAVDSVDTNGAYSADDIETAIESGYFKAAVLDKLLNISGLRPDSYRFASTQALIFEKTDAVFQFYLLDGPEGAPGDQSLDEVYKRMQSEISKSALPVDVNGIKFSIRKGSLTEAEEVNVTNPPPPSSTTSAATSPNPPISPTTQNPTPPPGTTSAAPSPSPTTNPTPQTPPEPPTVEPVVPTPKPSNLSEIGGDHRGALVFGVAFATLVVGAGVGVFAGNKLLAQN